MMMHALGQDKSSPGTLLELKDWLDQQINKEKK
jgi:hypothetical protein